MTTISDFDAAFVMAKAIATQGEAGPAKAKFHGDFILLTEFAEIKHGPQPLQVIPHRGEGGFDTTTFSVRVFSTDFQQDLSEKFSINPDSQVLISEPEEGAYAYVHYFALNDVQARGYLRQYCLSYITPSLTKLTDNFQRLQRDFSEATRLFKCGNHRVFSKDLDQRLADLEFSLMEVKMLEVIAARQPLDGGKTTQQSLVEFQFEDIPETDVGIIEKDIVFIKQIKELLEKEMATEESSKIHDWIEANKLLLRNKTYMDDDGWKEGNSRFYRAGMTTLADDANLYKPQRVMAHLSQRFSRQLRSLSELSTGTYEAAIAVLTSIQKKYSRSEVTLETEFADSALLVPISSLVTVGRVPLANMLQEQAHAILKPLLQPRPYRLSSSCSAMHDYASNSLSQTTPLPDTVDGRRCVSSVNKDLGFNTSFVTQEDCSIVPLYLDVFRRKRGLSIVDPLATPGSANHPIFPSFSPPTMCQPPPSLRPSVNGTGRSEAFYTPPITPSPESQASGEENTSSEQPLESSNVKTHIERADTTEGTDESSLSTSEHSAHNETLTNTESPLVDAALPGSRDHTPRPHGRVSKSCDQVEKSCDQSPLVTSGDVNQKIGNHVSESFTLPDDQTSPKFPEHMQTKVCEPEPGENGNESGHTGNESGEVTNAEMRPPRVRARTSSGSPHDSSSPVLMEEGMAGVGNLEISFSPPAGTKVPRPISTDGGGDLRPHSVFSDFSSSDASTAQDRDMEPRSLPAKLTLPKVADRISPDDIFFTPLSTNAPQSPSSIRIVSTSPVSPVHASLLEELQVPVSVNSESKFPFVSSVDLVESLSRLKPGTNLLQLFRDIPETRDLVFALLHGRPLVIIAPPREEKLVRRYVRALWSFVPGHSSYHQVIPWQTTPLNLRQLPYVKLIGLCSQTYSKTPCFPLHLKKYVSYWDWNNGCLCTPAYTGNLLNPILQRTRDKKSEQMFIALIQSVLAEMSMKAYIYYHGFCTQTDQQVMQIFRSTSEAAARKLLAVYSRKDKRQFMDRIGVKDSDMEIIEYLVHIVKRQQLTEWYGHLGPFQREEEGPPRMRLNLQYCPDRVCKPKRLPGHLA